MTEDQDNITEVDAVSPEPDEATATDDPAVNAAPRGNPGGGRWSVYDTQLARYVGDVTTKKPTAKEARALAAHGHAIVEV